MKNRGNCYKKSEILPSISLCMIVKNEEECLERCLKSVCHFVDELIIVDTGSTDQTLEIAESYGARVYCHQWENDFSKHRNQSLAYATGDWILQLDADEELFSEDGPKFKELIDKGNADFYHCRFYDIRKDGSIHGIFYLVRLFRNGLGMAYERKVHNQLQTQGREAYSSIRIRHYGYDLTGEKMEAKHLRTTTLLKEMIAKDPEDTYSIYQLSSSYSMHREFEKAVAYGEKALDLMRRKQMSNSYFLTVYHTVAQGYYGLGKAADAERTCLEALEYYPMHLDICHLLADIYFRQKSAEKYKAIADHYLGIHEKVDQDFSLLGGHFCHSFTKRHEIYFGLACVHLLERDFESADAYFLKSFEEADRDMERGESIFRFYLELGMVVPAAAWLKRIYELGYPFEKFPDIASGHSNLFLKMGKIYLQQENWEISAVSLQHAADEEISVSEQLEKRLLQTQIGWHTESIDFLVRSLESLMKLLDMNIGRTIASFSDLGQILYDVAEVFCIRQQWNLAESALQLAVEIEPSLLQPRVFERLLDHNPT